MAGYHLNGRKFPNLSDPGELSYPVMRGVSKRSLCSKSFLLMTSPPAAVQVPQYLQ
jgi:hypothetical protein